MSTPVILYVEDDPNSREVMQVLIVELMNIPTLTIFPDSADFMTRALALSPKPDLILLDIHVQPHSGFDMLLMLRAHPAFLDVPIVALTASVMNDEVRRLQQAGFDGVIPKPVDLERFPQLLSAMLQHHRIWDTLP
jgi:CheY-like chemotaxis protein